MVSMSRIGSTEPSTCTISASSKQRTTWSTASVERMFPRNWFPNPSPLLAPFTSPATVEIVDIAGLVKGASKGEGLGNQFLGNIRSTDAVLHVVRCFDDADIVHVEGSVDPIRDIETI